MRDPESGQARRPDNLTLANWDSAPNNRWAYQHISDFLPTVPIGVAIPMPLAPAEAGLRLAGLSFDNHRGERVDAGAALDASWTDGFLVMHRGRVLHEDYRNGMHPGSVHLTQSVSKSVVAALAGILHHGGSLRFHPRCYYRLDEHLPTETWPASLCHRPRWTDHRRTPHLARSRRS